MNTTVFKFLAVMLLILGLQQQVVARPSINSRVKRVSDPHLSDLETKIGLQKLKGIAVTLPVAPGIDFQKIGRKRRSQSRLLEALFNQSEEDQGDPRGGLLKL
ncbi:uncharacterized protein LOC115880019 [Sitophilus oryzae]|uniref:Uncharacterized protein LOC115880019 n=1 Tax=Sitophilus oryzae TaxID=7048 RepID=A0A6J2XQP4_SITOR|nr:uncharacterized protein LOC115880019 [Sitophilus oryzae]